jgi:predicted ATPase
LDLLESLVDQSLLQASETDGALRFAMLETVREYAAERLEESGEAQQIHRQHARHFLHNERCNARKNVHRTGLCSSYGSGAIGS